MHRHTHVLPSLSTHIARGKRPGRGKGAPAHLLLDAIAAGQELVDEQLTEGCLVAVVGLAE